MARFRLFGRAPEPTPAEQAPPPPSAPALPPYPSTQWGPPTGAGAPPSAGPATRAARPAYPPRPAPEPATDPRGLPPVPPAPPRPAWPARVQPAPDPAEAAALAGAFAVDYLSWDEEDPARRGRVLHDYLAVPGADPARIGWTGHGRQRADLALPGRVRPDGDGRVLVDVRVRVTPYRAVGGHAPQQAVHDPEPPLGVPAVAPAPTGRGWRSLPSCWVRLSVPVVLEGERLAVDAWEETLGDEEAPAPAPRTGPPSDHTLADDDPLAEHPRSAW